MKTVRLLRESRRVAQASTGFSLIEVLVASTILFTVITVSTATFRTNAISENSAAANVLLSTVALELRPLISTEVKSLAPGNQEGTGQHGEVEYKWNSTIIASSPIVDPLGDYATTADKRAVFLAEIRLQIAKGTKKKDYTFTELLWQ